MNETGIGIKPFPFSLLSVTSFGFPNASSVVVSSPLFVLRNGREKTSGNPLLGHIPLIPGNNAFYCLQLYSRNSLVHKHFCHLLSCKSTFVPFQSTAGLQSQCQQKRILILKNVQTFTTDTNFIFSFLNFTCLICCIV